MHSHLVMLILFAVMVSTVFAVLQRDEPREQARLAAKMALGFVGFGLLAGWVMLAFPLW